MNTHRPSDSARAFGGAPQGRAGGTKPRRLLLWILLASVALASALCAYGCVVADTCEGDGTCPREDASSSVDAASDQDAGDAGNPGDGEGGNEAAAQDSIAPCSDGGLCAATGDGSIADGASVDGVALGDGAFVDGAIDARMCDPTRDPSDEPCVLDNAYGVFVASPGDAGSGDGGDAGPSALAADGSMAHPYPTIAQALANLRTKTRIYVCNGVFGEHVTVTTPVSIYGGLSCAAGPAGAVWSYVGGQAQVTPLSPAPALTVTGVDAGSVTIEDLSFAAVNASAPGASSIAAHIASASVHLVRVSLHAGQGAPGAPGSDGLANPNYTGPAPSGGPQVSIVGAAGVVWVAGGPGGVNQCMQSGVSAGGDGGLGCSAGIGTAGSSSPRAPSSDGRDGLPLGFGLPDGGLCAANDPGADGLAGDGGAPPPALVYGTLSPTGWVPSPGADGQPGNPGQGGAGASDPLYEPPGMPSACGAPTESIGGGGGGAGGCGGSGGKGGPGGGASIALAVLDSVVNLEQCDLHASAAGAGGTGGAGQDGQAGGAGGDDVAFAQTHAAGAPGGNGAGGSGGAGGTGGISVGVFSVRGQVTYDPSTGQSITLGPPGAGGSAGAAGKHPTAGPLTTGSDGNPGAPGAAGTSGAFLQGV